LAALGFGSGPMNADNSNQKKKKFEDVTKICACGATDPAYKGYCKTCVEKMKKKYDYLVEKNNKLNAEYKKYQPADQGKSDEKMRLLKNKMAQYGALDANMLDVI